MFDQETAVAEPLRCVPEASIIVGWDFSTGAVKCLAGAAGRLGLPLASFVRMAVAEKVERMGRGVRPDLGFSLDSL